MQTQGERLKRARTESGFESASDAARALNLKEPTYLAYENGTRGISKKNAPAISRLLRIRSEWLLFGTGPMRAGQTVPLGGYVGAGGLVMPIDDHPPTRGMERVEAPPELGADTTAFRVRGDSQYPAFTDGDLIYVDTRLASVEDGIGRLCICQTAAGERMFKTLERGSRKGLFNLMSVNAAPLRDIELEWAAVVTWIKKK